MKIFSPVNTLLKKTDSIDIFIPPANPIITGIPGLQAGPVNQNGPGPSVFQKANSNFLETSIQNKLPIIPLTRVDSDQLQLQ